MLEQMMSRDNLQRTGMIIVDAFIWYVPVRLGTCPRHTPASASARAILELIFKAGQTRF
jgi:hypothetical protein